MAIITLSSAFCCKGQLIAEKTAEKLGYRCISKEILLDASNEFNIPEVKLQRAIHDSPSIFENFTYKKEKYISFIRAALLNHLKNDNIVYHGLAGHFFIQDVPHILKIRAITDMEDRIKERVRREYISPETAKKRLIHDDQERLKWSKSVYGMNTTDPGLYDMTLNINHFSIDDCAELICKTVQHEYFKPTPESLKLLDDMALSENLKAMILDKYNDVVIKSYSGNVVVELKNPVPRPEKVKSDIDSIIGKIPGVTMIRYAVKSMKMHTVMHK